MEAAPAFLAARPGPIAALAPRAPPVHAPAASLARRSSPPSSVCQGLPAAAAALIAAAAAWCRPPAGRRGTGRVVVYGRNYETNIRRKKGPAELRKARIVRKHLNKIILCVRDAGADEENNAALSRTIRMALKDNVPRSTIDNRIKKFVEDKEVYNELTMGGYGAGGTAVMVQCTTDSNIRARSEVREAFKAAGGQIGTEGCVDHLFTKQGKFRFEGLDEEVLVDKFMEADIDVEDVIAKDDGSLEAITLPENFHSAAKAFEEQGLEAVESDVVFEPVMSSEPSEQNAYEVQRLLHLLQELDDVQDVHHNAILPEGQEVKFNNYGIALSWEQLQKLK
uniref:Transcriptional regulatory protein n=1 Tax=Alexandrium monilatum TaxID=311494 RepID=A0A7S4QPH2_9DINO